MSFLRGTILAIGLMSFAVACGGAKKEAAEPVPSVDEPAGDTMGGDDMGGDENPCGDGDPCADE
jgi:hypothetical protein